MVISCGSRHPHRSSTARGTWRTSDIPPLPDFSCGGSIASGKPGFVERPQVTCFRSFPLSLTRSFDAHKQRDCPTDEARTADAVAEAANCDANWDGVM